jgi:DNA-binding GntR family transcriptional regulator
MSLSPVQDIRDDEVVMSAGSVHGRGVPLWRQLADQIADEIRTGARAPGSKLPSVVEMQETRNLSQSTTMRAYRELAAHGLAVAVAGSGTYVADPLPDQAPEVSLEELAARLRRVEDRLTHLERTEDPT